MITVKDRKLIIPENEKLIGFEMDNQIEERRFQITESRLFDFSFKLDLQFENENPIAIDLDKIIESDSTILLWEIIRDHLLTSGEAQIQLRAFNDNGLVWHSEVKTVEIKSAINATNQPPPISQTEFDEMEQRITFAKNETLNARETTVLSAVSVQNDRQTVEDLKTDIEQTKTKIDDISTDLTVKYDEVAANLLTVEGYKNTVSADAQQVALDKSAAQAARVETEGLRDETLGYRNNTEVFKNTAQTAKTGAETARTGAESALASMLALNPLTSGTVRGVEIVSDYPLAETTDIIYLRKRPGKLMTEGRYNKEYLFTAKSYVFDGMLALFEGDGNNNASANKATWKNLSSGGNLTLQNFAYSESSGWTGTSLYFDGVDDTTNVITLPSNVYTIECVFKRPSFSGGKNPISNRWLNTSNASGLKGMSLGTNTYNDGSNYSKFLLWHGTKSTAVDETIPINTIYSFSVTFDPSNKTFYVYINGVLKKTVVDDAYEAHNLIVIGNWATNHATFKWTGDIYCARAYNRFLTGAEVLNNFNIDKVVYGI